MVDEDALSATVNRFVKSHTPIIFQEQSTAFIVAIGIIRKLFLNFILRDVLAECFVSDLPRSVHHCGDTWSVATGAIGDVVHFGSHDYILSLFILLRNFLS